MTNTAAPPSDPMPVSGKKKLLIAGIAVALILISLSVVPSLTVHRCIIYKDFRARGEISGIISGISLYYITYGYLPSSIKELYGDNPRKLRFFDSLKDPWGNEFVLVKKRNSVICGTYGADGRSGGKGNDADWIFQMSCRDEADGLKKRIIVINVPPKWYKYFSEQWPMNIKPDAALGDYLKDQDKKDNPSK